MNRLLLCLAILCLSLLPVEAQELVKPEINVAERVRVLENELERQNSKLDQLQKTLEEQQLTIKALLEKLSAQPSATVVVKETEPPPPANASAPAEPQKPTIEQRLENVEKQAMKIGPVRVSGDFRLRWDGIFRSATEPPDPPLDHVQNSRGRYRFRLNFDTDIHPNLSFHAQLATGPPNNPVSTNQDFTSITARPPFSLSEVWVEYRPTKSIQLQGGRVPSVFADNSRFLFDDDIRFHGFNERYVANFKEKAAYFSSLEFRAGQYIFSSPNVAVIAPNSPLARAGDIVGTTGRSATLFHQGFLANQTFNKRWNNQLGADIQIYNHPNH
ncbi:MAG TPA: putative porin, partial [Pyrinomonadaceae bacterium]|nr:putative porin [Pyrinomonadaceae bacterium]